MPKTKGKKPEAKQSALPTPAEVQKSATVVKLPAGVKVGTKEEKLAALDSAKRTKKERKEPISAACRRMVLEGKTNEQIWAYIQPEYNMPEKHKHYPGWYRAQMVRQGQLKAKATPKVAKATRAPAPAKA